MAERILRFRNQQLGDGVVTVVPATQPVTPVVVQPGLYQETAGLACEGRNLVYRMLVEVYMSRNTPNTFAMAAMYVQNMAGLKGELIIEEDGDSDLTGYDWYLENVPPPNTLPGYGGRFIDRWPLLFVGDSPLESS